MDVEDINLLKQQLAAYIDELIQQGHLDDQFKQVQMLQDSNNPTFVVDTINSYCQEFERTLRELTHLLNQERIDYKYIDVLIYRMIGSSASIGAHQVNLASTMLSEQIQQRHKEALSSVRQKFCILQSKLEQLIQMEERIRALENADT